MTEQPDVITISSLIRQLQAIRRKRGDLRVCMPVEDGDYLLNGDYDMSLVTILSVVSTDIPDVGEREVVLIQ